MLFLSYRRTDSPGHAGRLRDALATRFGAESIFKDVDGIEGGDRFSDVIRDRLTAASAIVLVIGPRWSGARWPRRSRLHAPGDWVRREIELARGSGMPIIPVLVDGAELPPASSLPPSLRFLIEVQTLRLRDDRWLDDVKLVFRALESASARVRIPVDEALAPGGSHAWWWQVPAVIAAASLALVAWMHAPPSHTGKLPAASDLAAMSDLAVAPSPDLAAPSDLAPPPAAMHPDAGTPSVRQRALAHRTDHKVPAGLDAKSRVLIEQAPRGEILQAPPVTKPSLSWIGQRSCEQLSTVAGTWDCVNVRVLLAATPSSPLGMGDENEAYCHRSPVAVLASYNIDVVRAECKRLDEPVPPPK